MVCFLCFSAEKPEKIDAKGAKGEQLGHLLRLADNPNAFQTNMLAAPAADPVTCLFGFCCAFTGIPACCTRKEALQQYGQYPADYVCCQGYVPKRCGMDFPNMCKGSELGMCLEGCCCPVTALSMTRMYVMDVKNLHPDPVDYQLIAFSNALQMLSCICHILAMIMPDLRELALLIDVIADCVTASVAGCMTAQIHLEVADSKKNGGGAVVAEAVPMGAPATTVNDSEVSPNANKIVRN